MNEIKNEAIIISKKGIRLIPGIYLCKNRKIKYLILLIIIFIFFITLPSNKDIQKKKYHYIFTFWEPKNSIPGYIELCIKTWKKFVPSNYKIVILNYSNIRHWLDFNIVKKILCKEMTLPIQADSIRVAILQKYGGIWMDADNIITNSNFTELFSNSSLQMFGRVEANVQNIGFIYASNNSIILKRWLDGIINRVKIYRHILFLRRIFPTKYNIKNFKQLYSGNYLGNGIVNRLVINASENDFKRIEKKFAFAQPELQLVKGNIKQRYIHFYFSAKDRTYLLKKCKGILLLHNSWTPRKYKKMTEKEFLNQNIMLARLLKRLLNDSQNIKKF